MIGMTDAGRLFYWMVILSKLLLHFLTILLPQQGNSKVFEQEHSWVYFKKEFQEEEDVEDDNEEISKSINRPA